MRNRCLRPLGRAAVLAAGVSVVLAGGVAAQGLTTRLAPEFSSLRWGESVGLSDADFFGAAASIGFGRYVILRGSYKTAGSVSTALAGSGYTPGATENTASASIFATEVQLRFGNRRIAPVALGGGGILGLSPDGREDVRQIAATYGGGFDARLLPWLDGQLLLQRMRFRLDRSMVAGDVGAPIPADPDGTTARRSLAVTASLGARIGGGRPSVVANQLDADVSGAFSGGQGLRIPVEVNAGVLRFSEGAAIGDQSMGGVRAGFDFGPYFGLRGSYARGFSSASLVGMSAWSGEAQFNVGRVTGASPHLLLGYGGLSFWGDFRDQNSLRPVDESALIVGAGFGIPVSDRSRFIVSLRDYVTSPSAAASVSTPSDLRHNFGLSTGLSFALRAGRQRLVQPGVALPGVRDALPVDSLTSPDPAAIVVADRAPADTVVTRPVTATSVRDADSARAMALEPAIAATIGNAPPLTAADSVDAARALRVSYQSGSTVSIPIPIEGELYVRYGPPPVPGATPGAQVSTIGSAVQAAASAPGGVPVTPDSAALARLVRAEIGSALDANTVTRNDLSLLESRIAERLAATLQLLDASRQLDSANLAAVARAGVGRAQADSAEVVRRADLQALEERISERLAASIDRLADQSRPTPASASPELDRLAQQVRELSDLVRQRENVPGQPMVPIVFGSGDSGAVIDGRSDPFLRGASLLMGSTSVRSGRVGFGVRGDVHLGEVASGRLHPYLGVHAGRAGVRGTLGGQFYTGNVTSIGGAVGVTANLPDFRSIAPELNLGLVGIGGGTSGNSPAEATLVEEVYGDFVMGPRLSVDATWERSTNARWSVATSLARTWAGARGGWSFQVGASWRRPSTWGRAVFFRTAPRNEANVSAPREEVTAAPAAEVREPPVVVTPPAAPPEVAVAAAPDSATLSRIAALETELQAEREARRASEASADSIARSVRNAQEAEAARLRDERAAAEASRDRVRTELTGLLGVVEDVQTVHMTERGLEVVIGGGVFPTGRVELEGQARARVERVATVLARAEGYSFVVDGHTDSTGSDETNRVISRQRAEAVRAVLIGAGIRPDRIEVLASGESVPVAGNDSADGRARNRRVEIVIIDF